MPAQQKKKMFDLGFKHPSLADMKKAHDKSVAERAKLEALADAPAQPGKGV